MSSRQNIHQSLPDLDQSLQKQAQSHLFQPLVWYMQSHLM